ncbi:PhoH family protein [Marivirga sp. S37H4]|uniref:PhoH family protein n=1 Tax=Marivirga aurantiaca TaxID=2802615 RepID=A0A935C801_9BACT|nr:PhoH family protein [Marivirga aurantiaca]MBK6265194.1 PhoH family protein [Marivirga aurantiaca]
MAKAKKEKKVFVLDTSVIIYSHDSIMNFAEHDVAIPITVLEELDQFKKGNDTKNFEAREFIRMIDKLANGQSLNEWNSLNGKSKGNFKVLMPNGKKVESDDIFLEDIPDHKILGSALQLQQQLPDKSVILVTKDINLRLKAKSCGLRAEDYETGKIKNVSDLHSGKQQMDNVASDVINKLYDEYSCEVKEVFGDKKPQNNTFFILKSDKNSALGFYNPLSGKLDKVEKKAVYGVKPRNAEQAFAIHALLNPDIKLITLQGVAGTGKTLIALASALELRKEFKQIYLARPIVPLSNKDIGFLPGDIKSKLNPYMEPLWDNLKFIQHQFQEHEREFLNITDMVNKEKLMIQPLAYIRGRSLSNIFFIVDEAQNLTPHEVKTIITRAGENTKIVFTGDVNQIDTPYLDSQSNGLSYLIDKVKGHELYAHITLEKGERSELANLANDVL